MKVTVHHLYFFTILILLSSCRPLYLILNTTEIPPELGKAGTAVIFEARRDKKFNKSVQKIFEQEYGGEFVILTYEEWKKTETNLMATIAYSTYSDKIYAIGTQGRGNIVEKSVPTLDFILKNNITEDFEINFSVRNILNPDIKFVRETNNGDILVTSTNGKGVSGYNRGRNIGFQLKYKF